MRPGISTSSLNRPRSTIPRIVSRSFSSDSTLKRDMSLSSRKWAALYSRHSDPPFAGQVMAKAGEAKSARKAGTSTGLRMRRCYNDGSVAPIAFFSPD